MLFSLKVHLNGRIRPHVLNMFARASLVTQDCSGGRCDVMRAKGPKKSKKSKKDRRRSRKRKNKRKVRAIGIETSPNAALQNCVEGKCQRLISTAKISKQFCSHCTKMHCFGARATNCTQICVIGKCNHVQCDAEDCQQACLQNSTCTLKCGKNVKTCLQVCEEGSTCELKCEAAKCKQVCAGKNGCKIFKKVPVATTNNMNTTTTPSYTSLEDTDVIYVNATTESIATATTPTITPSTRLTTLFKETLSNTLGNELRELKTTFSYTNKSEEKARKMNVTTRNSSNRLELFPSLWAATLGWILGSLLI